MGVPLCFWGLPMIEYLNRLRNTHVIEFFIAYRAVLYLNGAVRTGTF